MSLFPRIKLKYFAGPARADAARLAFHIGGVPFIDERVPFPKFVSEKDTFPFGQLPVLEVDGRVFAQSQAILRYAGRLAGLYPSNDAVAALRIDEILNALDDALQILGPSMHERDPEKKKAMRLELAETTIPRHLSLLEARLTTFNKYATLQTKDVLLHDLAIYTYLKSLRAGYIDHIPVTIADGYALLNASFDKMASHPKVVEWYGIQHSVPKLKLTYLPHGGRADPIRLALFLGDIAFEDERITHEELAVRKPSLPFNQLPVLEVDGDVVAQSLAILRYAGSLSGLYPTVDVVEAFQIDELFSIIDELHNVWGPSFRERDMEKKLALRKVLAEDTIPKSLGFLEKRASQNAAGAPYAVGTKLTVADLAIASLLEGLMSGRMEGVPTTIVDPFVRLNAIRAAVRAHPKVAEWHASHA